MAFAEFVPGVVEVGDEGVAFGAGAGYDVHLGGCISIRRSMTEYAIAYAPNELYGISKLCLLVVIGNVLVG